MSAQSEDKKIPFQISWSHYQVLMKIENADERNFYEKEAILSNWDVRTLKRQYNSSLFERLAMSREKDRVLELANNGITLYKPQDFCRFGILQSVVEMLGTD